MKTVGMHEAKTHLSKLVEETTAEDPIIIARNGEPVAMLVPYTPPQRVPVFGALAHLLPPGPHDWSAVTAPTSEEELREWEEGHADDPLRC